MEQTVVVELKNDLSVQGTLKSVDQFLNIKLDDISVLEEVKYPHLVCMGWCFWGLWGGLLGGGKVCGFVRFCAGRGRGGEGWSRGVGFCGGLCEGLCEYLREEGEGKE